MSVGGFSVKKGKETPNTRVKDIRKVIRNRSGLRLLESLDAIDVIFPSCVKKYVLSNWTNQEKGNRYLISISSFRICFHIYLNVQVCVPHCFSSRFT